VQTRRLLGSELEQLAEASLHGRHSDPRSHTTALPAASEALLQFAPTVTVTIEVMIGQASIGASVVTAPVVTGGVVAFPGEVVAFP
jgi:hypothetical protein